MRAAYVAASLFIYLFCTVYFTFPAYAACSNPAGSVGDIVYNADYRVPQYCNDTNWVAFAAGSSGEWNTIESGNAHSCAIRKNNSMYCWGTNSEGVAGNNTTSPQTTPGIVGTAGTSTLFTNWVKVAPGIASVCGIRSDGTAWCWGDQTNGRLGNGVTSGNQLVPSQLGTVGTSTIFTDWQYLSAGLGVSCGIRANGTAWCWGNQNNGKLGNGVTTNADQSTPVQVGTGGTVYTDWLQVTTQYGSICGVRQNGEAWCWGVGSSGEMGNGTTTSANGYPVKVGTVGTSTVFTDWKKVSSGSNFACGLRSSGTIYCWGTSATGELGDGNATGTQTTPVLVGTVGTGTNFTDWVDLSAGVSHSCGVRSNGTAWCWGNAANGRLGYGSTAATNVPVQVGTAATGTLFTDWVSVSGGTSHSCGTRRNGTVWCWGRNQNYQLGNGTTAQSTVPVQINLETACVSPTGVTGEIIYNKDAHMLQWCDGVKWNAAARPVAGAGGGGCSGPTGVEGEIKYNSTQVVLQYCDGTNWVGIR